MDWKERFESKIKIINECWEFNTAKDKDGYAKFWINELNRSIPAHRASYILYKGEFDKNLIVCHTCDNPCCVNPNHLFLGTQKDNMTDKVFKNRQAKGKTHRAYLYPEKIKKGEFNGNSKLSFTIANQIRLEYSIGNTSCKKLSKKYGISSSGIHKIITNKSYINE